MEIVIFTFEHVISQKDFNKTAHTSVLNVKGTTSSSYYLFSTNIQRISTSPRLKRFFLYLLPIQLRRLERFADFTCALRGLNLRSFLVTTPLGTHNRVKLAESTCALGGLNLHLLSVHKSDTCTWGRPIDKFEQNGSTIPAYMCISILITLIGPSGPSHFFHARKRKLSLAILFLKSPSLGRHQIFQ
jgi:hypothetical protein